MTIDFISWLVFGALCLFAEFAVGSYYLTAVGFAFIYPSLAAFFKLPTAAQLLALFVGSAIHILILRRRNPAPALPPKANQTPDIGQRVDVIEWIDEDKARVRYNGQEWEAEKLAEEMPQDSFGIIERVQYGRLFIATGEPRKKKP